MSITTVTYCSKHPKEETALTCASCGTPICPQCMITTPVGMKCRDCGLSRGGVLFTVNPGRLVLAGLTALVAGAISTLAGSLGFLMFFLAFPYGYFAGAMILRASGMKRGKKLEIVAGCCIVAGATLFILVPTYLIAPYLPKNYGFHLLAAQFPDPFTLIAVAIVTACAVSKIRYL